MTMNYYWMMIVITISHTWCSDFLTDSLFEALWLLSLLSVTPGARTSLLTHCLKPRDYCRNYQSHLVLRHPYWLIVWSPVIIVVTISHTWCSDFLTDSLSEAPWLLSLLSVTPGARTSLLTHCLKPRDYCRYYQSHLVLGLPYWLIVWSLVIIVITISHTWCSDFLTDSLSEAPWLLSLLSVTPGARTSLLTHCLKPHDYCRYYQSHLVLGLPYWLIVWSPVIIVVTISHTWCSDFLTDSLSEAPWLLSLLSVTPGARTSLLTHCLKPRDYCHNYQSHLVLGLPYWLIVWSLVIIVITISHTWCSDFLTDSLSEAPWLLS